MKKHILLKFKIILIVILNFSFGINISYSQGTYCSSTPSTPYTFNLSSIAVSSNLPIGQNIPGTEKSISFSGHCDGATENPGGYNSPGDPIIGCYYGIGSEIIWMKGVYDTGVPGIGIALTNSRGQRVSGAGNACDTTKTPLANLDSNLNFNYKVKLSLIKTSNRIKSASLLQSNTQFGMGVYQKDPIGSPYNNYIAYSGDIVIRNQTCTVSNKNINVSLGDYNTSDFPQIGSVSSSKTFNVVLNCDAGANVSIRIDGTSVPGTNGVIALSSGSNGAGGIGVQIMKNNNEPITIGQAWPVIAQTSQGNLSIPFNGRYYRIGDVTEGPANAMATFTMIYS